MFIQTPPDDPALMQFTPGEPVLPVGNAPIDEAEASEISPLARRLLRIDGIEGVALSLDHADVAACGRQRMVYPETCRSGSNHGTPRLG